MIGAGRLAVAIVTGHGIQDLSGGRLVRVNVERGGRDVPVARKERGARQVLGVRGEIRQASVPKVVVGQGDAPSLAAARPTSRRRGASPGDHVAGRWMVAAGP